MDQSYYNYYYYEFWVVFIFELDFILVLSHIHPLPSPYPDRLKILDFNIFLFFSVLESANLYYSQSLCAFIKANILVVMGER